MSVWWSRARGADRSARLLLEAGDAEGAINRAYYAMFDVARAVLSDIDPELADAKKHQTVIRRFSEKLVRERGLDPEIGKDLRKAFDARLLADYGVGEIGLERATQVVETMERFLAALASEEGRAQS